MSAEQVVGGMITLITNSQIRYEGTLGQVDAVNNTVSLTNVRVYGTEGRAKNGQVEVPPSDQMFDQIIFRGSDITDLTVFEQPANAMVDPAILSAQPARANPPAAGGAHNSAIAGHANSRVPPRLPSGANQRPSSAPRVKRFERGADGFYTGGYRRGGHGGRGGYRGARRSEHTGQDFRPATGAAKEEFKDDFDFKKSREEFEKKKNEFEKAKEDAKLHSKAYDKNTFFDKISCDAQDRGRPDREGMKRADTETFGSEMVGAMRGPRRGRGGRGRYNARY